MILKKHIKKINLKVGTANHLSRCGINYVEELIACTEDEVLAFRNIGPSKVREIKSKLEEHNLSFKK